MRRHVWPQRGELGFDLQHLQRVVELAVAVPFNVGQRPLQLLDALKGSVSTTETSNGISVAVDRRPVLRLTQRGEDATVRALVSLHRTCLTVQRIVDVAVCADVWRVVRVGGRTRLTVRRALRAVLPEVFGILLSYTNRATLSR